jgi:hypothetical protein
MNRGAPGLDSVTWDSRGTRAPTCLMLNSRNATPARLDRPLLDPPPPYIDRGRSSLNGFRLFDELPDNRNKPKHRAQIRSTDRDSNDRMIFSQVRIFQAGRTTLSRPCF